MAKTDSISIRISAAERITWTADAERRGMDLSQWLRSAAATFCVCGKNTVSVPAGDPVEPAYVHEIRREIAEVKRLQAELHQEQKLLALGRAAIVPRETPESDEGDNQ